MRKVVTTDDARADLAKYVEQAKSAQPLFIGDQGRAEVVLIAVRPKKTVIKFGVAKSRFKIPEKSLVDQDQQIQELFYGKY